MLRTLRAWLPCPSQELITYPEMNLAEKQPEPPAALHLRLGSQPPYPLEAGGHGTLLPLGLLYLLPLPERKEPEAQHAKATGLRSYRLVDRGARNGTYDFTLPP